MFTVCWLALAIPVPPPSGAVESVQADTPPPNPEQFGVVAACSDVGTNLTASLPPKALQLFMTSEPPEIGGGEYTGEVDVVYAWYNSNDPDMQAAFEKRLGDINQNDLPEGSLDRKRFTDAGELKYSLRSLQKYATWVRKVHIVAADGMDLPSWLDTSKVSIVRHSKIFPGNALPTFNSHAIEGRLHYIDDLSDTFVYANDDMFLNRPSTRNLFFTSDGRAKHWSSYTVSSTAQDGHAFACRNTFSATGVPGGWQDNAVLLHQMKGLHKSEMSAAEHRSSLEGLWAGTVQHPFRMKSDIWPILASALDCMQTGGKCEHTSPPSSVFAILNPSTSSVDEAFQQINSQNPSMFCINDSTEGTRDALRSALEQKFPAKSRFEK